MIKGKRVVVTGGKGFLGTHLIKELENYDCKEIIVIDQEDYDLTNNLFVIKMYADKKPDIVIHLAAKVGGIGFNQDKPAELFYDNLIMGTQMLHQAYKNKIEKFVAIGTICAYPKYAPVPFKEEDIWNGYPEETNAPYGLAKKMMLVQSQAYRQQYDFNSIFLLPVNLYGPGDNFNPNSSHVIPALIKKCMDAIDNNQDSIEIWGTGLATREFFYVEDAARAICMATDSYDESEPINLGSGFEISIEKLTKLIVKLTGFKGKIIWNTDKPDGQPRRMLDTSKALREFGFVARTNLESGLIETIEWYKKKGGK